MLIIISGILAAAGLWLGFPNPILHLPPLALLYPALLYVIGVHSASGRQAFRAGLFSGIAGMSACLYWVAVPLHDQAGFAWPLAVPAPILISTYLALYGALFSYAVNRWHSSFSSVTGALFFGLLWGVLEAVRGVLFTGFPWLTLPAAFVIWPVTIQPLRYIGTAGYAATLVFLSLLCIEILRRRSARSLLVLVLCSAAISSVSWVTYITPVKQGPETIVAMVQGNIDQGRKWEKTYQDSTVNRYITMTMGAMTNRPADLIIWPETSMPFYLQEHREHRPRISALAKQLRTPFIIGTPGYENGTHGRKWDIFNRAYLIGSDGEFSGHYDKEHLVPFGEYLPLGVEIPFLSVFLEGTGDFVIGRTTAPLHYGNLASGILICYETIFPELAQKQVASGANFFVNISNDAWFGKTSAPAQHLHMAALRAVEQNRYIARGTNTGYSAVIDPKGNITSHGGLYRAEVVYGAVAPVTETTPYFSAYHFITPCMVAGLFALFILARRKER